METEADPRVRPRPRKLRFPFTEMMAGAATDPLLMASHSLGEGSHAAVSTVARAASVPSARVTVTCQRFTPSLVSSHQTAGGMISGGKREPSKG